MQNKTNFWFLASFPCCFKAGVISHKNFDMFPCLDPLGLSVCLSRDHSLMIGEEKTSVAISGRSSHKMTGLVEMKGLSMFAMETSKTITH